MWTAFESHEPPGRTSRPDGNRMTLENYPLQVYPLVPGLLRIDGVYHTWDMIPTTANCETKSLLQLALSISSEPLLAQLRVYYASLAVDFHQFLVKSSPVVAHVSLPTKRFSVKETIFAARCSIRENRGTVLSLKSDATAKFVYATANVFLHDCTNAVFQVENYSGRDDASAREKSTGREREPFDHEGKIPE